MRFRGDDGAQGAVADADRSRGAHGVDVHDVASLMVVAQEDDPVAGGELDAADADSGAKLAGGLAPGADGFVELRHLGVAVGEDELRAGGILAAVVGVGGEELGPGGGAGVGPVEAAGLLVAVESGGDAAAGEVLGGLPLPGLVLAADGVDAGARVLLEETAEGVAGADRLQ